MSHAGKTLSDNHAGTLLVREWLSAFAGHVRTRNFAAARTLFVDDVVSFGTWTGRMDGLDTLVARQWTTVWPKTTGFSFELDDLAGSISGDEAWAAVSWSSQALKPDGTPDFYRHGRATFIFRRSGDRLLAVHSHFSLDPAGRL